MTIQEFEKFIDATFKSCAQILTEKGKVRHNERDNERFEQFKRIARLRNCHITDSVYRAGLDKHLTILYKLVDDATAGHLADPAVWSASILDAINYLAILRAIVYEVWAEEQHELGRISNENLRSGERELKMQITSDRRDSRP